MADHFVIFSHGFGVYRDDRGLFPDIIDQLPGVEAIMFDYNRIDATTNTLFATPLEAQVEKLKSVTRDVRAKNPDATIDLICHSQGCVIAAMARLDGIRKTIFLAPPDSAFGQNIPIKIENMTKRKMRPGTKVLEDGSIHYPRRDGSMTVIPPSYWKSRQGVDPVPLYDDLSKLTSLVIIQADQDEVIGTTDFSRISPNVEIIHMNAGHDFREEAREKMTHLVAELVMSESY